jgi:UDP-N-acetylmuramyl pentapeptide phosphotransferase/UDP-N-acetylglucosamine-1-phosphate transferase
MDASLKKVLFNVVYYSLIAVMVAFVVFFLVTLPNASMAQWERISYYILTIALVLVVIFDIICTITRRNKYIAGLILYVITMLVIILSLIIMALNSANGRLLIEITERFFRIIMFSYLINVFAILIYCTGEKLIVHESNRGKK